VFCKKCGKETKLMESFCRSCGNDLRTEGILETKYTDEPKSQWIKDLKNKWAGKSANGPIESQPTRRENGPYNVLKLADGVEKPNLFGLSVGIARYDVACGFSPSYNLNYTVIDALDIVNTFSKQEGKFYKQVYFFSHTHPPEDSANPRFILKDEEVDPSERNHFIIQDEEATRDNIEKGIHWIKSKATDKDISVIFLSGHGGPDQGYIPAGFENASLTPSDLVSALSGTKGKTILFLDCCFSGNFQGQQKSVNHVKMNEIWRELITAGEGVVIITSSTNQQMSYETTDWKNGAFTMAIREGILEGKADYEGNGIITLTSLELYLSNRVRDAAKSIGINQYTTTYKQKSIPDFPIARVG
jgi:hypothetical protein